MSNKSSNFAENKKINKKEFEKESKQLNQNEHAELLHLLEVHIKFSSL